MDDSDAAPGGTGDPGDELRSQPGGHDVVAADLPCDDDRAGLAEYADAVVGAVGDRRDVVLVASPR